MSKHIILLLSVVCGLNSSLPAQIVPDSFEERVTIIQHNIQQYFFDSTHGLYYETIPVAGNEKAYSYLWPLCALIQGANEVPAGGSDKDIIPDVIRAINQYYDTAPPAPGYASYVTSLEKSPRFYDDNQWIAIAALDMWDRTAEKKHLDMAREIYHFMMTGYDTISGGGIYWRENDYSTKNTCSNGPGILIALRMYNITKERPYLDTALQLYHWVNRNLQAPSGIFYDNLQLPSLKIDSTTYTYNTGTMLESNVWLYILTKEDEYLNEARRIARAAHAHFYRKNRLPNHYWFNAVLLRGLVQLYKIDKDPQLLQYFIDDAERIWQNERDQNNLLGRKLRRKSLIDQAAMLEIYARLVSVKKIITP